MKYILGISTALCSLALGGCQDHFDAPDIEAPKSPLTPNMSILDLKKMYWDDATNYIDTIGIHRGVDDGKEYVISGRVISSDECGNVFKSLIIQDETAALAISINSYNLYLKYRVGQEIVLDLKGMYIGKYNGLVQLGMPEWYESGNVWEASFMAPEFFESHAQLNGFPEAAKVDTLTINSFDQLPSNPDGLCRYQSQIVRFNNVYFQNGGKEQFSEYHSSGVNQNIVDIKGSTLPIRTSGYSNFWNKYLPEGNGDVVCILSYYGTTGWQLILNDYEGCMNFGHPTVAPGTKDNPYTIADAIATVTNDSPASGWVSGYIVGAVAPEVTEVKSNDDIQWGADVVLRNTLVIGATPDTRDISQAMVIALPASTPLRQYGNLRDNPSNYKKQISVNGKFGIYMNTYGILECPGRADDFEIEGVDPSNPGTPDNPGTGNSADFNTLNGGKAATMSYGTYTSAAGWTAQMALVLAGGTESTNFVSTDADFLFPCLDGTHAKTGKLTSPTLTGGLGCLTFCYGFPFNETKVQFTVNILQNGGVVASDTVLTDPTTKGKVYEYSHDFNIKGDFVIEIVNDCATGTESGNKDRVAIWSLSWTN